MNLDSIRQEIDQIDDQNRQAPRMHLLRGVVAWKPQKTYFRYQARENIERSPKRQTQSHHNAAHKQTLNEKYNFIR